MTVDLVHLGNAACATESDVEQKLIWPLLTATEWLALPTDAVFTKQYLPPTMIDKGSRRIGYYPDYSIWIEAIPVMIVEAKSPLESVEDGFREAQLYAHEVNKSYPAGINPVQLVFCTNGKTLKFGAWDSADAVTVPVLELRIASSAHSAIREELGFDAVKKKAALIRSRYKPTQAFRPLDFSGGEQVLSRRIELNSFATDIAPLVRMFFASESAERLDDIIERAYVSSDEITKYDQILETFLRDNIQQVQDPAAKEISTTHSKEGMLTPELRAFKKNMPATGHIQLIIGPVGSGKSLFCQRYYRHLQPADIQNDTYWSFIDFNKAPENLDDLELWVSGEFLRSFEEEQSDFDLYSSDNLHRIFAPDLNKMEKIYDKVKDNKAFDLRVADETMKWVTDQNKLAKSLCRYIVGDVRDVVVVVFDNVDKRDRDQQLRIFQVAQWFRAETRAFCVLPLRDETYEQFKTKPPLDAFINAIHFVITPPRFIDVVRKRLELCLDYLAENSPDKLAYYHQDGKQITYPSSKLGEFLKTLYVDIFKGGRRISWLLEALAGRNVRQSLEMFTKILMSGHLDERQITGTLLGGVTYTIRDSTIVNVLMKTDYLYFDNEHGFVSNVLYCDPTWERHSNFLVIELLEYLVSRRKQASEIGSQGYFAVQKLLDHVNRMGFAPADAMSGLHFLLRRNLISADHMGRASLRPSDYVRAHASGFVHIRLLLENIHYVAGVAPATFFLDRKVAERVSHIIRINPGFTDIQFKRKQELAYVVREYLRNEYERHCQEAPLFENQAVGARFALRMLDTCLEAGSPVIGAHVDRTLFD